GAGDQLELLVQPVVPGGPGDHPLLMYTVIACGQPGSKLGQPFNAILLLGGGARLAEMREADTFMMTNIVDPYFKPIESRPIVTDLMDLAFTGAAPRHTRYDF